MASRTKWITAAAVGGVLTLGVAGASLAQQQQPPAIDVNRVVSDLNVTGDLRTALTERLNAINARLARSDDSTAYCYDTWDTLSGLDLTSAQWRQLHQALWDAGAIGPMRHAGGRGMGAMHGAAGHGHAAGMGHGMHGAHGMPHEAPMGRRMGGGGT